MLSGVGLDPVEAADVEPAVAQVVDHRPGHPGGHHPRVRDHERPARLQLADAITAELPVSLAAREAIHLYTAERRAAAYFTLPDSAAGEIPAPTEEEVKTFYNDRKSAFRAPEVRSVNLLVLDPASLAKPDAVTDAEARARIHRV